MTSYRLIGFWRSEHHPRWPNAASFVDSSWDAEERQLVVEHLKRGMMIQAWMGFSACRFCGTANGNLDLTDGVYLWPQGLAHYVDEHAIRLPEEFVEHVPASTRTCPQKPTGGWVNTRPTDASTIRSGRPDRRPRARLKVKPDEMRAALGWPARAHLAALAGPPSRRVLRGLLGRRAAAVAPEPEWRSCRRSISAAAAGR